MTPNVPAARESTAGASGDVSAVYPDGHEDMLVVAGSVQENACWLIALILQTTAR